MSRRSVRLMVQNQPQPHDAGSQARHAVQGDFAHDNSFDYMGDQGHDGETRITVWALRIGVIVMPLAFLMAGIWHYSNDPGLAIWLVPPAALLVIFGIAGMALATRTR